MEETITFDFLHNKLLMEIKNSGKAKDIAIFFNSGNSIDDMFRYFYYLEETQLCLNAPTVPRKGKSEEQADKLRTEGNHYYQQSLLDQALELYNLSILVAPHPIISSQTSDEEIDSSHLTDNGAFNNEEYRCLALGFANRSAVLFEFQQYDKCVSDIDLALKYGYPKPQQHKLAERKAKCLLALKRQQEAELIIQASISTSLEQGVDEAKIDQMKKQFDKLLQQCQQGKLISKILNNNSTSVNSTLNKSIHFNKPILPILDNPNASIPCFSDALKLAYEPNRGRFVVAERDIKPGTLVSVERAYGSYLLLTSGNLRSRCSTCFIQCDYPMPCPTCSQVMFCSEKCRESAMVGFHKVECSILPSLLALKICHTALLAFRCITQLTFQELKTEINFLKGIIQDIPPEKSGFNEKGIYDSDDLRTVFSLVDNIEQVHIGDLFKRCSSSYVLTKLLMSNSKYSPNKCEAIENADKEDILFIGSTIMKIISNLACNAYSIGKLEKSSDPEKLGTGYAIGSGVFPAHSLQNHSCNPATVHCTVGNNMITYASRFIPAGSEVTVSYGFHYALDEIKERRSELKEQFYFDCICDACIGDWPTFNNLSVNPCFVSENNCSEENENIKEEFKVLKQNFQIAYQHISNTVSTESDRQSVIDFIEFLSKHVAQPNKMFFEVQESLKKCLGVPSTNPIIK